MYGTSAGLKGFSPSIGKYFTVYHSEIVLLAMITENRTTTYKAIQTCVCNKIRRFQIPPVEATEYQDMVVKQSLHVAKPPVAIYLTYNELEDMISAPTSQSLLSFASPITHRS